MSVIVNFHGRLGNNLFQYAFGRIIAEHHNLELRCLDSVYNEHLQVALASAGKFQLDVGQTAFMKDLGDRFKDAPLYIPGRQIDEPTMTVNEPTLLEFQTILEKEPGRFLCSDPYQKVNYYAPYRESIRQWFRFDPVDTPFDVRPHDVVVNVRGGFDFDMLGWTIPLSFYEEVVSMLKRRGRMYVCGTGIDLKMRDFFDRFDAVYYDGTPFEHFCFMARFNRIILSNSSFAWWAAYLSNATEIYAPIAQPPAPWSRLSMEESRYHEIPVAVSCVPRQIFARRPNTPANIEGERPDNGIFSEKKRSQTIIQTQSNTLFSPQAKELYEIDQLVSIGTTEVPTLAQWLLNRFDPFSIDDIPACYADAANGNPATLVDMLFSTGLVMYDPDCDGR